MIRCLVGDSVLGNSHCLEMVMIRKGEEESNLRNIENIESTVETASKSRVHA